MTEINPITIPEVWKAIPDFPGYEVSDHGRVRSFWRQGRKRRGLMDTPQKILRPFPKKDGYLGVCLFKNGKVFILRIHRLVLLAFVGPCPLGMQSCHADGTRTNNFLKNLRWDTPLGNGADAKKHGSHKGMKNGQAKLTESQVKEIRALYSNEGYKQKNLGEMFSVCPQNICQIVNCQSWKHVH